VLKLEDEVLQLAELTIEKMLRWAGGEAFEVKGAFNCYTADVFSQYAFGEPIGFLEQEGWEPNFGTWTSSFLKTTYMSTSLERPFYCFISVVSRAYRYVLSAAWCYIKCLCEAQKHLLDHGNPFRLGIYANCTASSAPQRAGQAAG
jgi:hypothetical protein